jgi:hypothetical protein
MASWLALAALLGWLDQLQPWRLGLRLVAGGTGKVPSSGLTK